MIRLSRALVSVVNDFAATLRRPRRRSNYRSTISGPVPAQIEVLETRVLLTDIAALLLEIRLEMAGEASSLVTSANTQINDLYDTNMPVITDALGGVIDGMVDDVTSQFSADVDPSVETELYNEVHGIAVQVANIDDSFDPGSISFDTGVIGPDDSGEYSWEDGTTVFYFNPAFWFTVDTGTGAKDTHWEKELEVPVLGLKWNFTIDTIFNPTDESANRLTINLISTSLNPTTNAENNWTARLTKTGANDPEVEVIRRIKSGDTLFDVSYKRTGDALQSVSLGLRNETAASLFQSNFSIYPGSGERRLSGTYELKLTEADNDNDKPGLWAQFSSKSNSADAYLQIGAALSKRTEKADIAYGAIHFIPQLGNTAPAHTEMRLTFSAQTTDPAVHRKGILAYDTINGFSSTFELGAKKKIFGRFEFISDVKLHWAEGQKPEAWINAGFVQ
jgi:hypothetical protein